MTKLRAKTWVLARARNAVFGHYLAIKWPNFNIFGSDLFYMINSHKVRVIAKLQLNWVLNADVRAKKPLKNTKTRLSQFANIAIYRASLKIYQGLHFSIFFAQILRICLQC